MREREDHYIMFNAIDLVFLTYSGPPYRYLKVRRECPKTINASSIPPAIHHARKTPKKSNITTPF
jgi:hypothetical protein